MGSRRYFNLLKKMPNCHRYPQCNCRLDLCDDEFIKVPKFPKSKPRKKNLLIAIFKGIVLGVRDFFKRKKKDNGLQ